MASTETFSAYAPTRERSIGELVGILRDGLLVGLAVAAAVVAFAVLETLRQPSVYSSRGQVVLSNSIGFLSPRNTDALPLLSSNIIEIAHTVDLLQDVSQRYATLAADPNEAAARRRLATVDWLRGHVSVLPVGDTSLLNVVGTASSQTASRDLSDATVQALLATVVKNRGTTTPAQQAQTGLPDGVSLTVFALGEDLGKTSPTPVRNLGVGMMAGLILGTAAAAAFGTRRRRLHDPLEIAEVAQMQLFAVVDHVGGIREALLDPGLSETRARLQVIADDQSQVVLVTGIVSPETIAVVSMALVRALAVTHEPAALVDGDLATRTASTAAGVGNLAGLADLGADDDARSLVRLATPADGPRIEILPAGTQTAAGVTLLAKGPLEQVVARLKEDRRYVVVAGPTIDRLAAAIPLFAVADIALVLTPRGIPARKLDALRRLGPELSSRVAGTIVVGSR